MTHFRSGGQIHGGQDLGRGSWFHFKRATLGTLVVWKVPSILAMVMDTCIYTSDKIA